MQQQNQIIEWRRAKVMELLSKGENNQSEIARILQVDKSIICRDIRYLRQEAKTNIRKYIDERLPEEYEKCLVGITAILRETWITSQQAVDKREKIQALSLAKECYSMKLELLLAKEMLGHAKMILEKGQVAINPVFDKLITSLRTAIAEEHSLDKEATSYDDILDAYQLALKNYAFTE